MNSRMFKSKRKDERRLFALEGGVYILVVRDEWWFVKQGEQDWEACDATPMIDYPFLSDEMISRAASSVTQAREHLIDANIQDAGRAAAFIDVILHAGVVTFRLVQPPGTVQIPTVRVARVEGTTRLIEPLSFQWSDILHSTKLQSCMTQVGSGAIERDRKRRNLPDATLPAEPRLYVDCLLGKDGTPYFFRELPPEEAGAEEIAIHPALPELIQILNEAKVVVSGPSELPNIVRQLLDHRAHLIHACDEFRERISRLGSPEDLTAVIEQQARDLEEKAARLEQGSEAFVKLQVMFAESSSLLGQARLALAQRDERLEELSEFISVLTAKIEERADKNTGDPT